MSIPCTFKDGTGVSVTDADAIMRALGFSSAMHAEEVIGEAERRRKARKREKAAADARKEADRQRLISEMKAAGRLTGDPAVDGPRIRSAAHLQEVHAR